MIDKIMYLMLDTFDTIPNFDPLDSLDVGKHTHVAEVVLGQHVRGQGGSVVGGQGDQMVEDSGFGCGFLLEVMNPKMVKKMLQKPVYNILR